MEASSSPNAACDPVMDTRTIFIVDYDGTCTADAWPKQGAWLPGAIDALNHLLTLGRVKIFSSRLNPYKYGHDGELLRDPREVEADVQAIRAVLDSVGLDEVEIHTTHGKPTGHYYIDNRGIEFSGSWAQVLDKIEVAERGYLTPTACAVKAYGHHGQAPRFGGLYEFVTTNVEPIPEEEELTDLGEALKRMSDGVTYWKSNADGSGYEEVIDSAPEGVMRTFGSGATRNKDTNKHDYEGFLSPLVVHEFGKYMHSHRHQADGTTRDSDNWQKGIPLPAYMKSGWRHLVDWWSLHRGIPAINPDTGASVDFKEALCGVIFNASGYLHEILKAETTQADAA